ncbi:thiol:disulfide interchange protein DsbC [Persephonella hydrogeniphila]|uniref:Thiol:disulfide interchange protein DsbC n=1 Tax=Persephonella hydrogeniphila TaxID=198703 RepID=A0A285N358_9AQUI|nr:DsbC family protein [Persephonella hydrogeniphila]SNZ03373.1 thiol:disulfide interchange protein DsbC [Persephonella hydrogeniphila]
MKRIILGLFLSLVFGMSVYAQSDVCAKKVSVQQVKDALEPVLGGAKVIKVSPSPVKGLYEVIVEARGRQIPVYIDCSERYLITGEIIDLKEKKSITRERARELAKKVVEEKMKKLEKVLGKEKIEKLKKALGERFADIKIVDLKKIPKENLILFGNPAAKMTVYVVTDPECPFCAKFDTEMMKVLEKRKDVKFELILFPLPFHKHAQKIVQRIVCEESVKKKKEILEKSFKAVRERDEKKLAQLGKECEKGKKVIQEHFKFGSEAGIGGTPAIIFPYGIMVSGWMTADQINKVLDALK